MQLDEGQRVLEEEFRNAYRPVWEVDVLPEAGTRDRGIIVTRTLPPRFQGPGKYLVAWSHLVPNTKIAVMNESSLRVYARFLVKKSRRELTEFLRRRHEGR